MIGRERGVPLNRALRLRDDREFSGGDRHVSAFDLASAEAPECPIRASHGRPLRARITALARCRQRVRSAATRRALACGTCRCGRRNSPDFIASLQPEQLRVTSVHSVRGDTRSDTREPGNGGQRWLSLATDDTQRPVNPGPPSTEAPFFGRPSSRGTKSRRSTRRSAGSGRPGGPRRRRPRTRAINPPDSGRVAAGTGSSSPPGGSSTRCSHRRDNARNLRS
jgi:hypothetical protein